MAPGRRVPVTDSSALDVLPHWGSTGLAMKGFTRLAPHLWLLVAVLAVPRGAAAALSSESSSFGADTITHDSATDFRWLDLTLSAGLSHTELLQELSPGGMFEGYQLATQAQVSELFVNAGIDVSAPALDEFVPQNYAPIVALAALVGQLGDNGNCGAGCSFAFSAGLLEGPPPSPGFFPLATLAWFDNTAGQDPGSPAAPVGRASLESSSTDPGSPGRAAWLVAAPEPGLPLLLVAGGSVLAIATARRRRVAQAPGAELRTARR